MNREELIKEAFKAMENAYAIRNFYVGDRSAPVKIWAVGQKIYESISFDIIER